MIGMNIILFLLIFLIIFCSYSYSYCLKQCLILATIFMATMIYYPFNFSLILLSKGYIEHGVEPAFHFYFSSPKLIQKLFFIRILLLHVTLVFFTPVFAPLYAFNICPIVWRTVHYSWLLYQWN
jgi:hypothetical protein